MKIKIEILEAENGEFSKINLRYTYKHSTIKIPLYIDFKELYDFSKDTTSIAFDFFFLGSVIYGIDKLIGREKYSVDGWTRELEVCFPVEHIKKWNKAKQLLSEALCFLTGDNWNISFEKRKVKNIFKEKKKRWKKNVPIFTNSEYQFASLFSGGLDSLIGVINNLKNVDENKKVLAISHFDSNSPGANSYQTILYNYLSKKYKSKITWLQTTVTLNSRDIKSKEIRLDTNYRSRSLLFISIGCYLISSLKGVNTLLIPENGTISLNYPITPSRCGSLSTRTTHPYFISKLQNILYTIDMNTKLDNPYSFKTKGEMIAECKDKKTLKGIYEESVSCGKGLQSRGNWDHTKGVKNCGACIPCLNRRSALHLQGWDNQIYGYDLSINKNFKDDVFAMVDFLKKDFDREQIKRGLLVNGSLPLERLNDYSDVILRSRYEMLNWFRTKGSREIKSKLKLND